MNWDLGDFKIRSWQKGDEEAIVRHANKNHTQSMVGSFLKNDLKSSDSRGIVKNTEKTGSSKFLCVLMVKVN